MSVFIDIMVYISGAMAMFAIISVLVGEIKKHKGFEPYNGNSVPSWENEPHDYAYYHGNETSADY